MKYNYLIIFQELAGLLFKKEVYVTILQHHNINYVCTCAVTHIQASAECPI